MNRQQLYLGTDEKMFIDIKYLNLIIPKIKKMLIKTNSTCLSEVYNDLLNWRDILTRYSDYEN